MASRTRAMTLSIWGWRAGDGGLVDWVWEAIASRFRRADGRFVVKYINEETRALGCPGSRPPMPNTPPGGLGTCSSSTGRGWKLVEQCEACTLAVPDDALRSAVFHL